jgi:hypothetical protein
MKDRAMGNGFFVSQMDIWSKGKMGNVAWSPSRMSPSPLSTKKDYLGYQNI